MTPEDRKRLQDDDTLRKFLSRASRFAEKGRLVPRLRPDVDLAEFRRFITRLRRGDFPPPASMTHEDAVEMAELSLEQEEIIRDTARDMRAGRALWKDIEAREAQEAARRDVIAFHALKAEAARKGGEKEMLRELHRVRRAAGGRTRGRGR